MIVYVEIPNKVYAEITNKDTMAKRNKTRFHPDSPLWKKEWWGSGADSNIDSIFKKETLRKIAIGIQEQRNNKEENFDVVLAEEIKEISWGESKSSHEKRAHILDLAFLLIAGAKEIKHQTLVNRIIQITGFNENQISRILRLFIPDKDNIPNFPNNSLGYGYLSAYWLSIETVLINKKVDTFRFKGFRKGTETKGYINESLKHSLSTVLGLGDKKKSFAPTVKQFCKLLGIKYSNRRLLENYYRGMRFPDRFEERLNISVNMTLWMLKNLKHYKQSNWGAPTKASQKAIENLVYFYLTFKPSNTDKLGEILKKINPDYKVSVQGIELAGLNFAINEETSILGFIHIARELGLSREENVNSIYNIFKNILNSENLYSRYKEIYPVNSSMATLISETPKLDIREYVSLIYSSEISQDLLLHNGGYSMIENKFDKKTKDLIYFGLRKLNSSEEGKAKLEDALDMELFKKSNLLRVIFGRVDYTFDKYISSLESASKSEFWAIQKEID